MAGAGWFGLDNEMAENAHATGHLPWFITPPGETDILFIITTVAVLIMVITLGVFFFRIHSLPEQLGHKKLQWEIVSVLALISLFTHQHIFWIIALILALIEFPDFWTPLQRMSRSLEQIAQENEASKGTTPATGSVDDTISATLATSEDRKA